ncbi:MAG TPA: PQQ-dependent sugar dehydrogenase [Methylomirabilota bacterium]|nr:PQQ-dependent sugar dehydrogenase [Methylomirabilota bacterium]
MAHRARSLSVALIVVAVIGFTIPSSAHPPWNPYDATRFAPITSFGPSVGIEVVARATAELPMTSPLKLVAAPGLPGHVFVVDQTGQLWVVRLSDKTRTLYHDVSARLVTLGVCGPGTFDERGFLGLAFHPNFNGNGPGRGRFYTYTSERRDLRTATIPTPGTTEANADHQNVVIEWVAANPGNPTAPGVSLSRELIRVNWPQFNHNGGDLAFGPDGRLYISTGDGGGADDADGQQFVTGPPHKPVCGSEAIFGHQDNGNGQKLNTPLGKILRIDPDKTGGDKLYGVSGNPFERTPGAVPEIWSLGHRNPFRFSFDRATGVLYVGDVGQNDIEEVDIVTKGGNYGWNCKEGTLFFYINGSVPDDGFADRSPNRAERKGDCSSGPRPLIDPVAQYDTHHEGHSVIGGHVYTGTAIPALAGKYVFADFSLLFKFPTGPHDYGRLFSMDAGAGTGLRTISEMIVLPGGSISLAVLGSGQDASGEIYFTGNVSGLPNTAGMSFGNTGVVVRLGPAPEAGE